MDSAHDHHFGFNEAISFMVNCDTQEEIDYYWKKLSAVPEAEQCGWLKDKYRSFVADRPHGHGGNAHRR